MTLAAWLAEKKLSDPEFAVLINRSRSMVTKLRLRQVAPSFETAMKIFDVTNGRVPQCDLVPLSLATTGAVSA